VNEEYKKYAQSINQIFLREFNYLCRLSNKRELYKLLSALPIVYKRWYYSTIVSNTYLTPANLFEALNIKYNMPLATTPVMRMEILSDRIGFVFSYKDFGTKIHPITKDLRKLIQFCRAGVVLTPDYLLPKDTAESLIRTLHIEDKNYLDYLTNLLVEMDMLVNMPAINIVKARLSPHVEEILELNDDELFNEIVHSSVRYSSMVLRRMLPDDYGLDENYLLHMLKTPLEAEMVLNQAHDNFMIPTEDIIGFFDTGMVSSGILLNVLLDKFFLTPFSHYLKFIRPIYFDRYHFSSDILGFLKMFPNFEDLDTTAYSVCSRYFLTDIGLKYFNISPTASNYFDVKGNLDFSEIAAVCGDFSSLNMAANTALSKYVLDKDASIYTFMIKYLSDYSLWIHLEASDTTMLHKLFLEIAYYFDLDRDANYTLFPDEKESPFKAYYSQNHQHSSDIETSLKDFKLESGRTLVLSVNDAFEKGRKDKWTLKVLNTGKNEPGQRYPRVTRISKSLQTLFDFV